MSEESSLDRPLTISLNRHAIIIAVILILIISLIGAAVLILFSPNAGKPEKSVPSNVLTDYFSNITAQEAYNIIKNNPNVNIIDDPNSCHCRYDNVHIGDPPNFEAILITNISALPKGIISLYDTRNITIFYDDNGMGDAILHCRKLVNHSYGAIYLLEGGLDAWRAENYSVVKGD